MRAFRCFLAALLAAGIVSMVTAQPGGFGGGFGTPDVESLVMTNAALQQEVKITDAQKDKFKPIVDKQTELGKKFREAFSDGFDKDKFTELNKERQDLAAEAKKVRDQVLTADQKKRLKQIQVQAMALNVFNDPDAKGGGGKGKGGKGGGFGFGASEEQKATMKEVQDSLKLTDSQKSSIKGIVGDYNKERREIMADAGVGFGGFGGKGKGKGGGGKVDQEKLDAANKKVEKVRKEAMGKIDELLDEGQKKTWKTLTGDAFDTSKLRTVAPKKD
jgi:Spy/CpxP family protein refolding chaperone